MTPKGTGEKDTSRKGSIFAKIRNSVVSKKPLRIRPEQTATQKKPSFGSNLFVRFVSSDRPRKKDQLMEELAQMRGRVAELETLNSTYNEDQEILRYQGRMLQHLSVGIMMSRVGDGIIVDTNPGFELLFGYGPGELQGSHVSLLNAAGETSPMEVAGDILCALQGHGSWEGEVNNVRQDGSPFWSYARVSAFDHSEFGEVWLTVQEDITARKEAELKAGRSEERFLALFDSSQVGIAIMDRHSNITRVNRALQEMFGYTEQELVRLTVSELTHPDDMEENRNLFRQMYEGNRSHYRMEKRYFHKDGSLLWGDLSVFAVYDDNGDFSYCFAMVNDITARKQAEESLRRKARHIQQIMDSLPCFAMILNSKREIMALNKVASEMGGVIGGKCTSLRTTFGKAFSWCMEDDAFESNEFKNIQTWGANVFWDIYRIPLEDGLYLHFAFDRTESKKAEEKIHVALKEKEVLLAEIHHRVKNNLAIISAFLSLQSTYSDDEKVAGILQESQKRINAMALVHEKLYHNKDFTRIDFKGYVESLSRDLIMSYRARKNVRVVTDIDDITLGLDTLIPCGLLMNELITNSLKHGFGGIEAPEIRITLKGGGNSVELCVGDNGVGLPDYIQLSESRTLGLIIVRQLSGQLNSEMKIDRSNGTEFRFSFMLPQ